MHLSGVTDIAASRQRVWDNISNPQRAAADNSSGQASIEKIDDNNYKINVNAPGGMMPMNIVLNLVITDRSEPSHIAGTIEGSLMGGPINGNGSVSLEEIATGSTRVTWVADATLGGILGGFDGMIQAPAQQAGDKAFEGLKERLEAEEAAAE
jgi:carbon monoxide dehydrogenase subunit G